MEQKQILLEVLETCSQDDLRQFLEWCDQPVPTDEGELARRRQTMMQGLRYEIEQLGGTNARESPSTNLPKIETVSAAEQRLIARSQGATEETAGAKKLC